MSSNKKYSLGIYVNDWGFMMGSEGNPHVFLGLKIEKVKCNNIQIKTQENLYQHYLKHNMPEQANQCKINMEQMQCFINEKTLEDFKNELSEKYKYYLTSSKEFEAWQDTTLNLKESINKNFDKALREAFNNNFTFLRQCYADITEPFFKWLEIIKHVNMSSIKNFNDFQVFFDEFAESKYSNLDSIEGFFGFGPYQTNLVNNYKENKYMTGGKVFQNNHWNDTEIIKENKKPLTKIQIEQYKSLLVPRIPQNSIDKQYLIFSKDFTLTTMRPLKTFQEYQSEVIEISRSEYQKICKSILFQTLLSSDSIRNNAKIFGDKKMNLKIIRL